MTAAPLTIIHVVFSSRIAGGEQHCIDLAHGQAALGHDVHVVGPARSAVEAALRNDVRYHRLTLPILRGPRLRRVVKRIGADVCHAHLGPACKAAARIRSCVRLGTLHVGFKAHHHAALDGMICVNRAQQQQLTRYAGAFRVIHNWAPEREPNAAARSLRCELGITDDQLLVGAVGRLHPSKGMDLLVRTFKAHAPTDAVLAILGEGKDQKALEALAGRDSRIRLLGFRRDVDEALASMDLFVSPSREEAFPLAVLEAMRAGLPIIATATQGPQEMLGDEPATLVPVDNIAALGLALADSLARLRSTPRARRTRVVYDIDRYDRARSVRQVVDFYKSLLAADPAGVGSPTVQQAQAHV